MGTRIARALRLHCPQCGGPGILESWFKMRAACPSCGLLLDRGMRDFFIGAYLINLIVAEVLFAVLVGSVVWATWPATSWDALQYIAIAAIIVERCGSPGATTRASAIAKSPRVGRIPTTSRPAVGISAFKCTCGTLPPPNRWQPPQLTWR